MHKKNLDIGEEQRACQHRARLRPIVAALVAFSTLHALTAGAFEIETENPDLKMRWDNTLKYSNSFRLKSADSELLVDPNFDDGDRSFGKGLISNRADLLSEYDISYKNLGARISAAAWYDTVYNRDNDNTSVGTVNATSVPFKQFTHKTQKLHGRKAEILDAFAYGHFDIDGRQITLRAGKHTLLYGESLFFGGNGIAGAQAPVDVIKAVSVPGSQVKEILMPVSQLSTQIQLTPEVSVGAYYQLDWESLRLPAVGSYFSNVDIVGPGAERLLVGPGLGFVRGADVKAKDSGQGGAQIRFRPSGGDIEYGLYALRYHSKAPFLSVSPGEGADPTAGVVGTYRLVYPENIKLFGASFSTAVGDANVAGEVAVRRGTPLDSSGPGIAIGNTAHAQVSAIYILGRSAWWESAEVVGEVAWNRITSIKTDAASLNPNASRDAWGLRVQFSPTWYQVIPLLDLSLPINLGYSPKGASAAAPIGTDEGGDITIGVNAEYAKQWKARLAYTHYFGEPGLVTTFQQSLKDRDFLSFSVQRTF